MHFLKIDNNKDTKPSGSTSDVSSLLGIFITLALFFFTYFLLSTQSVAAQDFAEWGWDSSDGQYIQDLVVEITDENSLDLREGTYAPHSYDYPIYTFQEVDNPWNRRSHRFTVNLQSPTAAASTGRGNSDEGTFSLANSPIANTAYNNITIIEEPPDLLWFEGGDVRSNVIAGYYESSGEYVSFNLDSDWALDGHPCVDQGGGGILGHDYTQLIRVLFQERSKADLVAYDRDCDTRLFEELIEIGLTGPDEDEDEIDPGLPEPELPEGPPDEYELPDSWIYSGPLGDRGLENVDAGEVDIIGSFDDSDEEVVYEYDGDGGFFRQNPPCEENPDEIRVAVGPINSPNQGRITSWNEDCDVQAEGEEIRIDLVEGDDRSQDDEEDDSEGVQCEASGLIGFLACDVMLVILGWIEDLQNQIVQSLFEFDPLSTDDEIYTVWANFRNIANSLLVLAFMAVIFSLALSINVDAYTIKRIVPRLLIAAVAIQASFLISAVMVDITNILGQGIQGLSDQALTGVEADLGDDVAGATGTVAVVGTAIIGIIGAAILAAPFWAPLLLIFFLLLLGAFAIVALREIFIILFIVTSPIFFLANLLPATERWFKFWWSNFSRLLLMYPFMVLFIQIANLAAIITIVTQDDSLISSIMALLMQLLGIISIYFAFRVGGSALQLATNGLRSVRKMGGGGGGGKGPVANVRKGISERRKEFTSGAKGNKFTQLATGGPLAVTGKDNKPRNNTQAQNLAGFKQQASESVKTLEAEGHSNPKALNEFTQYGDSSDSFNKRIKYLRENEEHGLADSLEGMRQHVGKSHMQAAAFKSASEKVPSDAAFGAMQGKFGGIGAQIAGDAAFSAGKAGRPDIQAKYAPGMDNKKVLGGMSGQDFAKMQGGALYDEDKGRPTEFGQSMRDTISEVDENGKPTPEALRLQGQLGSASLPQANMNSATRKALEDNVLSGTGHSLDDLAQKVQQGGSSGSGGSSGGSGGSGGGATGGGSGAQGGGSSGSTPPPPPPPPPSPGGGSGGSQGPGSGPGGIIQPGDSDFNIPPGSRPPGN